MGKGNGGTSLPATVLGTLATFFISYATLVLGLAHGWLTVRPSEAQHTVALFQISWLVVFILLGLASVRLPAVFTALFASFAGALALLLVSTLGPSTLAGKLAGIVALLIGVAAGYVFLAVASRAKRRPGIPDRTSDRAMSGPASVPHGPERSARWPSGEAAVCKSALRGFDSRPGVSFT